MTKTQTLIPTLVGAALAAFALSSCSDDKPAASGTNPEAKAKLDALVQAFYDENADFFTFSSPDKLPAGLKWENGENEPELGSPEAKKGGTFNYYISDFPLTLRLVGPDASMGFRSFILDDNGGPGGMALTVRHPDTLQQIPCLAKEWAIGDDLKTVYFKLDPDARYSDGHPVTADDYVFMFYFMRNEWLRAPWYNDFFKTKFTNITKFDDHTISITVVDAKPDAVYRTALRPVARHFYDEFGEDYLERYNFKFEPTTGPYEVVPENLVKGRMVTLTKVKDWWAKDKKFYQYRYNPDKIRLQVIRDPDVAFEVFKKGEIDFHGLSLAEHWYQKLPDDDPLVAGGYLEKIWFYNVAPQITYGLRINCSKPHLDNVDVRVGIHHASNWQLVIDEVFRGDFGRMNTVTDGYGPVTNPNIKARDFDPAKAREHFAKAGFTKSGPDGILMNDKGERLSFTLTSGYKPFQDAFTVLKEEARKAGLELILDITEYTVALKKSDEKKHDISFSALNVSVELYPRFWETFHSFHAYEDPYGPNKKLKSDTNNDTVTAEKDIDEMIEAYDAASEMETITELAHKLQQRLHEDAAFVPAWTKPWYRTGKWRWMKYPEYFDQKSARDPIEMSVFWIDEQVKKETLEAKNGGKTFPPVIKTYDQHKDS